jgi:hypothetical protein
MKKNETAAEIKRLRTVEKVAKEILEPMLTANDGGAMWCAFSRENRANMPEERALVLVKRFKRLTRTDETKPKKQA